jgi:uncharacterized protein with HEPN domain
MQRDDATPKDLAQACDRVIRFLGAATVDGFVGDEETQSAVVHQLLIVGEATKRLSAGFRAAHPEIPWANIAGMRDRLIHAYDLVDLSEVWRTAARDVPELLRSLTDLLPSRPLTE